MAVGEVDCREGAAEADIEILIRTEVSEPLVGLRLLWVSSRFLWHPLADGGLFRWPRLHESTFAGRRITRFFQPREASCGHGTSIGT